MANMRANDNTASIRSTAPDSVKLRRAERDRRIAEIRARTLEFDPESTPEMKALRAELEEYRASIRASVRKITGR
jgi:hypothetical protein